MIPLLTIVDIENVTVVVADEYVITSRLTRPPIIKEKDVMKYQPHEI